MNMWRVKNMPDPLTSEIDTTPARPVCPSCILPISKHDDFCQNCFAPVGLTASIDPLKRIWAEGFLYKKAANDRITGFMLLSMWLILFPMILPLLFLLNEGIGQLVKGRLEFPDSYFREFLCH